MSARARMALGWILNQQRDAVMARCDKTMEVRLDDDPPAIVLVDGFTELAWLRYPGALDGGLPVPAAPRATISP